jgi:hypothetical protein
MEKDLCSKKNNQLNVDGYTNTDWAGNVSDRKSASGYFTFIGGNLVTLRSKKQKVMALSSAEAEFQGMAKGLSFFGLEGYSRRLVVHLALK